MSIPATCPGCDASYQLADTMRGKKVRCKSCSEVFLVGGKTATLDRDEDEVRVQASPRAARRAAWDEEDVDVERRPVRRRPVKKRGNSAAVPLIIAACVGVVLLVLAAGGIVAWALLRSPQRQPAPVAVESNWPPPVPQPVQAPLPQQQNQGGMPPPPAMVPPVQNPMPANGPLAVELTNANVSGFGAQMQVSVDYRFTAGNPGGKRLFLFIKATKAGGLLQNYYLAELRSIGDRAQGTINAAGMTFGFEHGPFELWMAEGPPGLAVRLVSDRDVKKISNVVTVAIKQPGHPGLPGGMPGLPGGMPGLPGGMPGGLPGMPGGRPPIGPRGIRP